jgi:hypothetical protein
MKEMQATFGKNENRIWKAFSTTLIMIWVIPEGGYINNESQYAYPNF